MDKEEIIKVLERAASDSEFNARLLYHGSQTLKNYNLSSFEKAALISGDITWIEENIGPLNSFQRRWLEYRLGAEIW